MIEIPIARPRMPAADALLPYLRRIDAARTYSNFGPLVRELEGRLAARLDLEADRVVTVSNATVGLTLALGEVTDGRGGLCLIPAWTFVATAHAVAAAGLTPFLVDVDEESWALTPSIALTAAARLGGKVAAVMPVAPFGAPLDTAAWDRFTDLTGIPAVIDAAAAHDTVQAGRTPAVVSLHATKILGAGEGGYVVSTRPDPIAAIRRRSNFGFLGARDAAVVGLNAKMSEYHAAVGLASMDAYQRDTARFRAVAQAFRERLAHRDDIAFQPGFGSEWVGSVCVARFHGEDRARVSARLAEAGIDSRAWWGDGVHRQTAFAGLPRRSLATTDLLARETLGLPYHVDMDEAAVARICAALDPRARALHPLARAA